MYPKLTDVLNLSPQTSRLAVSMCAWHQNKTGPKLLLLLSMAVGNSFQVHYRHTTNLECWLKESKSLILKPKGILRLILQHSSLKLFSTLFIFPSPNSFSPFKKNESRWLVPDRTITHDRSSQLNLYPYHINDWSVSTLQFKIWTECVGYIFHQAFRSIGDWRRRSSKLSDRGRKRWWGCPWLESDQMDFLCSDIDAAVFTDKCVCVNWGLNP